MKRVMVILAIVVLALCLHQPAEAVDLMASARYDFDASEGGVEVQVIGDVPIDGNFADHFFVAAGLSADDKSLDGYEGLLGVRFLAQGSKFNFGVVGGAAGQILRLVYNDESSNETYAMATSGAFFTVRLSDDITAVAGWQYYDPMNKDNAAERRHEFGVGLIATGLFTAAKESP